MKFDINSNGVDEKQPLIYQWEIINADKGLVEVYIGKAKSGASRPLIHYKRNVERLRAGKSYRKSKPDGFRRIHHALATAVENGYVINLFFVCNIESHENINQVERKLIQDSRSTTPANCCLND